MTYRLLACDIDNTLVRFPEPPTARVTQAIRTAIEHGTIVALVTGRAFRRALPVAQALGLDTPIICNHGGSIRDSRTGEMIHRETLSRPLAHEVIAWLQGQNVRILVFDGDIVYHDGTTEEIVPEFQIYTRGDQSILAPDLLPVLPETTEIILSTSHDHAHLEQVYRQALSQFGARTRVLFSHPFGLDIMPHSSKSMALSWLAAHLQVPQSEVMAVGDGNNDLDMISWAGWGVAIGDGDQETLAAADVVAPPFDHDGLAWAIETYILAQ